ncbi:hypothetical protein [Geodermatophilus sp. FMUSA9-8]|uniref:hypothetical protein n=1 Tax=Geodermatophilus sp. FMUSA9-8 TaxID=3120155 RepID=UPI003009D80A
MSRRRADRLVLGLSAGVIALTSACGAGGPAISAGGDGIFQVERPIQVVAGEGQAWLLTGEDDGAFLSRIDVAGRPTDVVSLPGQTHSMAPYRDGVVVTWFACADRRCSETVSKVLVLDGEGSTLSEQEYSRSPGPLEDSDGVQLLGVQKDLVWVSTGGGLIAYDPQNDRTAVQAAGRDGFLCLLADGLYALSSLSGPLGSSADPLNEEQFDDPYEVVVDRLDDGSWIRLLETQRAVTLYEFSQTECVGGAIRTGQPDMASPAWSSGSGWVEAQPYTNPGTLTVPREPMTYGNDARFVLESDGVIRRVFGAPDAPLSVEKLQVPADIFVQDPTVVTVLLFDQSPTVIAGCLQQPNQGSSDARCYIRLT